MARWILLLGFIFSFAQTSTSQPQLAWYWYEIAQNDSVSGGSLIVDLKVASDRIAPPQNRLRSATLDLLFDTTQVEYVEPLWSDLLAHNDSTHAYGVSHDLAPAPRDSLMRLTAFSMIDDEVLEEVGFVIGLDPVCIAKYKFTIKPPGLLTESPWLETVEGSAIVTFLDFLECTPSGYDGCTMILESPEKGPGIFVSSKVQIEGAHVDSAAMGVASTFALSIPLSQPYSDPVFDNTPLDYDSVVTLASIPTGMVDWVLVSLRTDSGPETEIEGSKRAGVLMGDGRIVDTSGHTLSFPGVPPGDYFLVVRHRNHLAIMTSVSVDVEDGLGLWDFIPSASQAFSSDGTAMIDMGDGSFAMAAGDANLDGLVTATDFNIWLRETKAVETGYRPADFNLDGQVTATDFNIWLAATKAVRSTQVPD